MTYVADSKLPEGTEIAAGTVPGWSVVHKFGRNAAVGTSFVPCSIGGVYQTVQPASATSLRVAAGNANDTAAGTGAREITLEGLDETGALVTEALATAGASASSGTTTTFIRLFRAYVSKSGTYATSSAGSHAANIVIENAAGGTTWATIDSTDFPRGQSEIGVYTVPLGYNGYVFDLTVNVSGNGTKPAELLFFQRANILEAAAPYTAMRLALNFGGVSDSFTYHFPVAIKYAALTDMGFMCKAASGTPEVDVEFDILLETT